MTRGERRDINKRKWFKKLKTIYRTKFFDWYKMSKFDGSGTKLDQMIYPKEWKDMLLTKDGVAYKETGTIWHNPKTEKNYYSAEKDLHKRDMRNKKLSKEEQEELDEVIENMENVYAFESYCGACENYNNIETCPFYGKVHAATNWEVLRCKKFWD